MTTKCLAATVLSVGMLANGVAVATDLSPTVYCSALVASPADGATNVPLDAHVLIDQPSCATPSFVDDAGLPVAFDRLRGPGGSDSNTLELAPQKPLEAGRTYTVELALAGATSCGAPPARATFRTSPAPAVRAIGFDRAGDKVADIGVAFSEPVADVSDLLPSRGLVTVALADAPSPAVRELADSAVVAVRSFKTSASTALPPADVRYRIQVSGELRFKSGAKLAGDFDQVVVPADFPFGWTPGAVKASCPGPAASAYGCGCAPAGSAGWALAALLVLGARPTRRRLVRG